jgi:ParB family transcriptional regulator, chromosome partitioning protein
MSKGLGKGLSSLIPQKVQKESQFTEPVDAKVFKSKPEDIKIVFAAPQQIKENPQQPRKNFLTAALADLVASIKEHGILQPLVVTQAGPDAYELVAGERRLRAARLAHLKTVPVIVRTASELEKLELSLIENIQRQDLNPIERATAYRKLISEFSLTHEQAAKRLGKSRPVVSNTLRLLDLPESVQLFVFEGRLSESHAQALLEVEDKKQITGLAQQIIKERLSKQSTRELVKSKTKRRASQPRIDQTRLRVLAKELESRLKTRVRIKQLSSGKYIVEMEVYSPAELEALLAQLSS